MGLGFYIENQRDGDLTYFNATEWVPLHRGTSGQFLTLTGAPLRPAWASVPASAPTDAEYVTTLANGTLTNEKVVFAPATQGSIPKVVRKTANETISANNSTLQDDNELLFAIGASETWCFAFYIIYSDTTATDIKFAVTGPASATGSYSIATDVSADGTATLGTAVALNNPNDGRCHPPRGNRELDKRGQRDSSMGQDSRRHGRHDGTRELLSRGLEGGLK